MWFLHLLEQEIGTAIEKYFFVSCVIYVIAFEKAS